MPSMYFHYIALISPWNRVWPNIWLYLNLLQLRMLCAKFCWNWVSGCGENENVYSRQTSRQMDSRRKAIREAHLGFQLWCAKKKKKKDKMNCGGFDSPESLVLTAFPTGRRSTETVHAAAPPSPHWKFQRRLWPLVWGVGIGLWHWSSSCGCSRPAGTVGFETGWSRKTVHPSPRLHSVYLVTVLSRWKCPLFLNIYILSYSGILARQKLNNMSSGKQSRQ